MKLPPRAAGATSIMGAASSINLYTYSILLKYLLHQILSENYQIGELNAFYR